MSKRHSAEQIAEMGLVVAFDLSSPFENATWKDSVADKLGTGGISSSIPTELASRYLVFSNQILIKGMVSL